MQRTQAHNSKGAQCHSHTDGGEEKLSPKVKTRTLHGHSAKYDRAEDFRPGVSSLLCVGFLVAGAGFEPATFGL